MVSGSWPGGPGFHAGATRPVGVNLGNYLKYFLLTFPFCPTRRWHEIISKLVPTEWVTKYHQKNRAIGFPQTAPLRGWPPWTSFQGSTVHHIRQIHVHPVLCQVYFCCKFVKRLLSFGVEIIWLWVTHLISCGPEFPAINIVITIGLNPCFGSCWLCG